LTEPFDETRLQSILDDIASRMAGETERGEVADYIPELARVSLNNFGIAVVPLGQEPLVAGDADTSFSIQSVSKVFGLTLALDHVGATLWQRVGREPSGDPFNSIVQLESERGKPRNPFINPGAIVCADVIRSYSKDVEPGEPVLELCRRFSGAQDIEIDAEVYKSESLTGDRNRALAYFMHAEGNLHNPVEEAVSGYFRQCSIAMSCRQLAQAGRFLAEGDQRTNASGTKITPERARRINALMMTCGCYDASGEVAFRIGLPCKSGVGGGILAIAPGKAAIAAWCPGLDAKGNSLLALKAIEELARATGWSVF
jgi:glutaminase